MTKRHIAIIVFALIALSSLLLSCGTKTIEVAKIGFDGIDSTKWLYNQKDDVYYQLGIVYVAKPADRELENLAIFIPAAFMDSKDNGDGTFTCTMNENRAAGDFGYTAKTAPVLFPMNTFGYSAQNPLKEYASYSDYTSQGMIYVHAGSRGRESGVPAGAVDLKAAIRFVRSQQGVIPGNMERVISFGMSGGGGMSLILGTSGDSPLFEPYLEEIGAAKGFSDAVLASQAWCPITTLDSADAAYEWMMGNTRANLSKDDEEISLALTQAYADYINALGLKDGAGNPLILEESSDGRYQSGSYYDFIKTTIETSLNNFLSDTKFPFDTASQNQDHGGQGGMGNVKPIRPNGGNMARGAEAMDNVSRVSNSGGITLSGIYNTAKDYIDALNANGTWVIYNDRMNKATITSVADFTNAVKRASKNLGAFDQYDKSQAENTLFGTGNGNPAHFDKILSDILSQKKSEYAQSYADDLALKDMLGNTQEYRMNMYSPLYYVLPSSKGSGTSKVAKYFRINSGLWQGDTSLSTEANIALALMDAGAVVNFQTVWGKGHTWAERKGESSTNFIQWVHDCIVSEEVNEWYDDLIRMDTHLHVDVDMGSADAENPKIDLARAIKKSGMNAIGMNFAVDYVDLTEKGQAFDRFTNAMNAFDKILEENNLKRTLDASDFKEHLKKGEPVVIQAVEGAHFLEGDVSRIQTAYDRGIRIFDVFHDEHANPSLGDVFGKPQVYGGLTDLGRETIREAERLGMVVDITHASEKTILDALQVVTKPFLLSHTALLSSLQSEGNPLAPFFEMRYISEELAKKIADAGGVIGVWPQITETPDVYAKRVRAMTNVVGTDHVALGSDSKITPAFDERKKSFNPISTYKNHVWTAVVKLNTLTDSVWTTAQNHNLLNKK